MANQGLRKCIQQKQVNIGGATAYVNTYSEDANFILNLPIFSTVGFAPIDISLIYNHQNKNEKELFGNGFKLNYYKKLEDNSSQITLTNADGSVEKYTLKDGYYLNSETHLKIKRYTEYDEETGYITYYYDVSDQTGNILTYEGSYLKYPGWIIPVSCENVFVNSESENLRVVNRNNNEVQFLKGNSGFIETIEWKKKGESRLTATLSYTKDGQLATVVVKNSSTTANAVVASYTLSISDSTIEVKDNMTGADTKFTLNGNKVTKIEEGFNNDFVDALTTTIVYNGTRTIITNPHGKASTIVYDKEGLTRLVKDDKENFVAYTYDLETKALLAETPLPKPNKNNNLLKDISLSDFTMDYSISFTKDNEDIDAFYQTHAGSKASLLKGNSYAEYKLDINLLPTDTITLIIWAKQTTPCVGNISGDVFLLSENNFLRRHFNKSVVDEEYFPFVMGFTITEASSYIDICFQFFNFGLEIGTIELYKRSFGVFYQYDSEGNVISSSVSGNKNKYSYANGVVNGKESLTNHGVKYKRDSYQRVTEAVGAYQTKQSLTYTPRNQVETSKIENFNSTSVFETSSKYDNDDQKVTYTDELGNTSIEERDNFFNVIKTTNQVNQVLESTISDSFELKKLELLTDRLNATYTYDSMHHNLVKTITMKNGMMYTFSYDEKDRISSISLNDILLVTYTYDKFNQILTLKYGSSNNEIKFSYTDYGQIEKIETGTKTYNYVYNNLGSLEGITSGTNTWEYTYNEDNKVEKFILTQSNQQVMGVQYSYDNLGNVNKEQESIFGSTYVKEYEGLYRSNGCNAENLASQLQEHSDFLSCMFLGNDVCLRNNNTIIRPFLYGTEIEASTTMMDEAIPCISVGSNAFKYKFTEARSDGGIFGFWYKLNNSQDSPILLRIADTSGNYIHLYINDEHKLAINLKQSNTISTIHNSSLYAGESGWHFLGINWHCYNTTTSFELVFDGIKEIFSVGTIISISSPEYTMFYTIGGKVSCIIAKNDEVSPVDHLILFYRSTFDYVFNRVKQNNALDYSCTTHYLAPSGFTLYPLHHDLKSLDGLVPEKFGLRNVIVADTDRTFNYNSAIGRYAYMADGAELVYDLQNNGSGTIGLRAYINSIKKKKQYLFDLYGGHNTIALYIDENGKLCLECLRETITTPLSLTTGKWHFVGLTFCQTLASDSFSANDISVRIVVDSNEYTTTISSEEYVTRLYCSVGRRNYETSVSTDFGSYKESYPLYGQIEMLSFNDKYSSFQTLTTLKSSLELYNKVTGYNEFGMLVSNTLKSNEQDIMRKTITYKSKPGSPKNKCSDIASESNFFYGKGTTNRTYETDNLGRLTRVTDGLFGNHTYSYDEKGYLKSEDTTNFIYDANGNIIQAGTKVYEYTGAIKDRLTKALGFDVKYNDELNPGNPIEWNGREYSWDRSRRLVSFKQNGNVTKYTYNAEGLRTSKTQGSNTIEYYYSGDRLIAEKNIGYHLNFLYDENGLLYGFIKDNSEKYFYIRDVYQNILGIIDSTGAIVVKYDCDAWGNHKVLDSNGNVNEDEDFIGNINPFRYKGYYYDKESNMYYCKSRYYVPQWCRWLNADSINCLNLQDIHGLNLFAYCNNNPVMGIDPTGNSAILIAIAIFSIAYLSKKYIKRAIYKPEEPILDGADFDFNKNYFSIFDTLDTAKYIKEKLYKDNPRRTVRGISVELGAHYLFSFIPIPQLQKHANPAYIGDIVEDGDDNAAFIETILGNGIVRGEYEFVANDYSNLAGFDRIMNKFKEWIHWPWW